MRIWTAHYQWEIAGVKDLLLHSTHFLQKLSSIVDGRNASMFCAPLVPSWLLEICGHVQT